LKIGILGTRGIPANYGGFELIADVTARQMTKRGHSVTVYCRLGKVELLKEYEGVSLIQLPTIDTKYTSTIFHTALSVIHSILLKDFDIIHIYNVGNGILLPILKLFGKKVVISVDGIEWKRKKFSGFSRWYMRFNERFAVRFSNRLIVDSRAVWEYYNQRYGIKDHIYLPSGVEPISSNSQDFLKELGIKPKRYLLFVGRLVPEKKIEFLIEGFRRLDTDYKLVIVGGNKYMPEYERKLRELASGDKRVILTGSVFGDKVKQLFSNAYLYVSPSELEGTSVSILEALSAGCCVLVNGIDENREVIADAGLFFRTNDMGDMVRKMKLVIDNPELQRQYSEKAVKRVKEAYSWDAVIDRYEQILEEVVYGK